MQIYTDNGFTLEENKEQILRHFKAVRDNKELGPIAYNGNLFDFDQKSYERINAAIIIVDTVDTDKEVGIFVGCPTGHKNFHTLFHISLPHRCRRRCCSSSVAGHARGREPLRH